MADNPGPYDSTAYTPSLRVPGVMEPCPLTPEGATQFERLSIDRAWRDMHQHARDAMHAIMSITLAPQAATIGNDAQALAKMHEQAARLRTLVDGVQLRLAVDEGKGPK